MMPEEVVTYAQNREDIILSAFFVGKNDGVYVDIGAADPDHLSVTKYFYDLGWHGINIEPNMALYNKINVARPRDINVNAAVGSSAGRKVFRQYDASGLSTLSETTMRQLAAAEHSPAGSHTDIEVEVRTLNDILIESGLNHIDFMKIDVEGYEYEVLKGNDWRTYRPVVICIEANHIQNDWPKYLQAQGYIKVFTDGLNDYYTDNHQQVTFEYIQAVIGREITPARLKQERDKNMAKIDDLESKLNNIEAEVARLRRLNIEKDERIEYLNLHIAELSRFQNMVKNLIFKVNTVIDLRLSQKFKNKKRYPKLMVDDIKDLDKNELLAAIKQGDVAVFNRVPTVSEKLQVQTARVAHYGYKTLTRGTMKAARGTKRTIKGLRTRKED